MKLFEDTPFHVLIRVIGNQGVIEIGDTDEIPLVGVLLTELVTNLGNSLTELTKAMNAAPRVWLFATKEMGITTEEVTEACRLVAPSVRE